MGRWDDKFERHAKKWESWNMQEYSQHDRVLPKILEDKARQFPDHVVFQFRDDPLTLGELNERINKTANGLLSLGVKHGDKVALMLPNNPEFLYTWFALNKIGAVEVPINVALKAQGLAYQMVQSDCVALVADLQYLDRLEGVAGDLEDIRHIAYTDSSSSGQAMPQWSGFEHLTFPELMDHSSDSPGVNVHYSDLATILYTSGTTGFGRSRSSTLVIPKTTFFIPVCRFSTATPRASPSGRLSWRTPKPSSWSGFQPAGCGMTAGAGTAPKPITLAVSSRSCSSRTQGKMTATTRFG